jgi:hypothetical protein
MGIYPQEWEAEWIPKSEDLLIKLWEQYRPHDAIVNTPTRTVTTDNQYLNFLEDR